MPTDTFYRLPQQKRDRLLAAIHGELSRVPVTELSVNRIVHEAGISRGSFYQYFRDRTTWCNTCSSMWTAASTASSRRPRRRAAATRSSCCGASSRASARSGTTR